MRAKRYRLIAGFCLLGSVIALAWGIQALSWTDLALRAQWLLSPGPLSLAHAHLDNPDSCNQCHAGWAGLDDELCLSCHEIIRERRKARMGYHGQLEGSCLECHFEHQGRELNLFQKLPEDFDHNQTIFPLAIQHQKLPCARCHLPQPEQGGGGAGDYLGLTTNCLKCHGLLWNK